MFFGQSTERVLEGPYGIIDIKFKVVLIRVNLIISGMTGINTYKKDKTRTTSMKNPITLGDK